MRRIIALPLIALWLLLAGLPGRAFAQPMAAAPAGPVFVFPTDGQTLPPGGNYLFQVQPLTGATGYLWSLVQHGAIVWQNLAFDGTLSPESYLVKIGTPAYAALQPGDLTILVRAQLKDGSFSQGSTITVHLQGAAAAPTALPTPGPAPKPGTVLYQADWAGGLNGWTGSGDWRVLRGALVSDGSNTPCCDGDSNLTIAAPATPGTANYAVEAAIRLDHAGGDYAYGIAAHSAESGAYRGGVSYRCFACSAGTLPRAILLAANDTVQGHFLANKPFDPGRGFHIYRLEVRGAALALLVDGNSILRAANSRFPAPGQIGLWSRAAQITVRSFQVIAL